ncbi:MAG TPA: hypothetical protein VHB79_21865 [Polyangiaceae bacterium]|nr:hypothetical protein [Polyangiaceae bacterium]
MPPKSACTSPLEPADTNPIDFCVAPSFPAAGGMLASGGASSGGAPASGGASSGGAGGAP